MEKQIKITEEELNSIWELREKIRGNVESIGRLNIQRHFIENDLTNIKSKIDETYIESEKLSNEENKIFIEITTKYGEGDLDFETGIYTKK